MTGMTESASSNRDHQRAAVTKWLQLVHRSLDADTPAGFAVASRSTVRARSKFADSLVTLVGDLINESEPDEDPILYAFALLALMHGVRLSFEHEGHCVACVGIALQMIANQMTAGMVVCDPQFAEAEEPHVAMTVQ